MSGKHEFSLEECNYFYHCRLDYIVFLGGEGIISGRNYRVHSYSCLRTGCLGTKTPRYQTVCVDRWEEGGELNSKPHIPSLLSSLLPYLNSPLYL